MVYVEDLNLIQITISNIPERVQCLKWNNLKMPQA